MFRVVVFSEMKGTVTLNGKPLAGVMLTRTADESHSKVYTQTTISDENGRYHFDEMAHWSFAIRDWFFDTRVYQEVYIEYDSKKRLGWQAHKNNRHSYGELKRRKEHVSKNVITCNFILEKSDETEAVFQIDHEIPQMTRTITGVGEVVEP